VETKLSNYTELALRTNNEKYDKMADIIEGDMHPGQPCLDYMHAITGLVTEAGELMKAVFPYFKPRGEGIPDDIINVKEELGDLCWYAALYCRSTGLSFEDCFHSAPMHFGSAQDMSLNLVLIVSEMADQKKRHIFYENTTKQGISKFNIKRLFSTMKRLMKIYEVSIEPILDMNIKKLEKRYSFLEFTHEEAINRDTENELSHIKEDDDN
jgi:hypothetical protein